MSQVLEKPILLDETGQRIVGKLDDIKDAIGTSAEFIPISIRVIAPPTKVTYKVGERLDLSGMVVNLIGTNGVQIDVTSACVCSPANGAVLAASDTTVAISYTYQHEATTFTTSQALTIRDLDSIAVTTPPIKTAYQTGETLDLTGIVVTATYTDGFTANVTPDCTFVPQNGTVLTTGDTSVSVSYTEGGTTKTTTVAIGVKELVSIAVTHLPTKTAYKAGETLDLTGIVVTATYDDGSFVNVTNNCTYSPDDGDTLTTSDTSVSISYTEGGTTKTTSQVITVKELMSIAITTPPTKVDYTKNEALDLTGIVVTATYSDSSTADVTASCTFNPADGTTLTTSNTSVTASYTEASVTKTATQAITVLPPIYGAEWDGTASTAWTRTDLAANFTDPIPYYSGMTETASSPFDNIAPWSGMAVVSDSNGGTLVSIPKFYYKLTKNGNKLKIQIANEPATGFHVSPAHMDRGDGAGERDTVYVGRFLCSKTDYKSTGTGTAVYTSDDLSTSRTRIHGLGTDIWLMDFTMLFTIWLLYLVEYADWDSQSKIGNGMYLTYPSQSPINSMPYHTGITTADKTTAAHLQYRYIGYLWSILPERCDGAYYYAGYNSPTAEFKITLNPADFADNSGGTTAATTESSHSFQSMPAPTAFDVFNPTGLYPIFFPSGWQSAGNGGYTTDAWYSTLNTYSSNNYAGCGFKNFTSQNKYSAYSGLFCASQTSGSGNACRLMKLPNS